MKLTVLGSGTMFLTKRRFPSAFLIEEGDTMALLDCGFGAIARMAEIGIDYRQVNLVMISHFHTDHFGDAFNLVHARFVGDIHERRENEKISFIGPVSLRQRFKKWRQIFWPEPQESYPLDFFEGTGAHEFGDLKIKTFPVIHVDWFDSIGFQIFVRDKKLVFPGDVGSRHDFLDLVEKSQDADLLIIESGGETQTPNHFFCDQIKELAEKAAVKKVLVVHNQHIPEEEVRVNNLVRGSEKFILAEDKMVINL